ncbi:MAG: hypothetical protein AB8H79_04225 [Myxococcota bacterium]
MLPLLLSLTMPTLGADAGTDVWTPVRPIPEWAGLRGKRPKGSDDEFSDDYDEEEEDTRSEFPRPGPAARRLLIDQDRSVLGTYKVGSWLGIGGFALATIGTSVGSNELALVGSLATVIGAPVMAGSSTRSQTILSEVMGRRPQRGAGYVAWACVGGYAVGSIGAASNLQNDPDLAGVFALVGSAFLGGSYIASGIQNAQNNTLRRRAGILPPRRGPRRAGIDRIGPFVTLNPDSSAPTTGVSIAGRL